MIFSFLLTVFVIILFYIISKWMSLRGRPPGPWGLPYIGSLVHFTRNSVFIEFEKYKQKYGKIFNVRLGNFDVIVISDYKLIQEAFKLDELMGRPNFELWKVRNMGIRNRGILVCDGKKTWSEQRRFALRNLRDFGFGKQSMEGLLIQELQELIKYLKKQVGSPVSLKYAFNASVLNTLWYMIAGRRFELDDPEFIHLTEFVTTILQFSNLVGPGLLFPEPVKYNLVKRGFWEKLNNSVLKKNIILKKEIDKHLESYDENFERDYIDAYIKHMKNSNPTSSFYSEEGYTNLIVVMNDLFVAGSETTSTTLLWAILYICLNPKVQVKIQSEIISVIGKERLPSRNDKPKMVYVEAVLNEVHRMCSLLPFSVFHMVLQDTNFGGYLFKAGSLIYPNLYEAHHNKDYWKDPEVFRPERFLDETETILLKHEPLMPFSTGKRICLGETLARDSLFLFLSGILQIFTFELDNESLNNISTQPQAETMVLSSKPFNVIIKHRV